MIVPNQTGSDVKLYTLDKAKAPKLVEVIYTACKAIDKQYLKAFHVVVNESSEEDAPSLEVLKLRFAYRGGVSMTLVGPKSSENFVR